MPSPPPLKIQIRLFCGDEIAMGPGKADLLDAIKAHGSISAAARSLGMSYRRAWLLVDTMNRVWYAPLVATAPGNAAGGGAHVTPTGEAMLQHYRNLQDELAKASDCDDSRALTIAMLAEPKAKQKA